MNPAIHFRSNRYYFVLISLFLSMILFISCTSEKEPAPIAPGCCDMEYIGEYTLLPSSRESIPYQTDADLFFRNEQNEEVRFTYKEDDFGYSETDQGTGRICPCDPLFEQTIKVKGDAYTYLLSEPLQTLNLRYLINLGIAPFHGEDNLIADVLTVSVSDENDTTSYSGLMNVLVDRRNLTDDFLKWYPETMLDSVELGGKTFYDVFVDDSAKIYYNYLQGLVAFKDRTEGLWVLDRIEELE